jgi:RNA polymerase sigma-70 factor, ECF subfamily
MEPQSTPQAINADVHRRATEVARRSYGKLVAMLAAKRGDIMGAEDALADAFVQALRVWPERGIPDNPEAWLMTAAKNRSTDAIRRHTKGPIAHQVEIPDVASDDEVTVTLRGGKEEQQFPDRRLGLLFVCAHPSIDAGVHTALMLQTVLGVEAVEIGRAFMTSPTAVAQRLVRAKRKIRDSQVPFAVPSREEMPSRLEAVLEAVYGAYAMDWMSDTVRDLGGEALYLAELLAELLPDAETLGLAALLGFSAARQHARLRDGCFVPIQDQDPSQWDHERMAKAAALLAKASSMNRLGRFQIEAAIQQAHGNWPVVLQLSNGLCALWPTVGAAVSRAAVVGEAMGPLAGLQALDAIADDVSAFQPAHATRAHLLAQAGQRPQAMRAYDVAISLTTALPVRRWLERQRDGVNEKNSVPLASHGT